MNQGTFDGTQQRLPETTRRAAGWLLRQQDHSGGWGEQAGKPPNVLNTAETVISLLEVDAIEPGAGQIQKAVAFLVSHQQGSGALCREVQGDRDEILRAPDVLRTALTIQALIKSGTSIENQSVKTAIDWLMSVQHKDGGWNFSKPDRSELLPTCASLGALMDASSAGATQCDACIDRGIAFLTTNLANNDGSFGDEGRLQGVHTTHAVMALQKARTLGRPSRTDLESAGLQWLLEHQNQALKLVEEKILLSDTEDRLNYHFLHMADTMVVTALATSLDDHHWNSNLYIDALRTISDRTDPSGGFFGHRVFSWSTARTVSALWRAKDHRQEIPARPPEFRGPTAGKVILFLALVLAAVLVYLSVSDSFGPIQALFLGFLMLACMLAYGAIGEKTFREIVSQVVSTRRKGNNE
jgi:prenyltransferase beta subunit